MADLSTLDWVAFVLAIVGALNWGLVGLAGFDLVAWLAGLTVAWLGTVLYTLVGLSGLYLIYYLVK